MRSRGFDFSPQKRSRAVIAYLQQLLRTRILDITYIFEMILAGKRIFKRQIYALVSYVLNLYFAL